MKLNNVDNWVQGKQHLIHRQGAPAQEGDATDHASISNDEPLQPIGDDAGRDAHSDIDTGSDTDNDLETLKNRHLKRSKVNNKFCWFPIRTSEYFEKITELNDKYASALEEFEKTVGMDNFDKEMLEIMLKTRSIAERALQRFRGEPNQIPAGMNLGGYQMMRMPHSVLFFHRLKLRNDTRFRVNYLHNDLKKLKLTARLSLHDLHLTGHYERTVTVSDLSVLFYRPTYGQVEFLLEDVSYEMDGHYRLLHDRLHIENVVSKIKPKQILMRYVGENNTSPISLGDEHLKEYLLRLRNDLDRWLKDYFNDFLIFFGLGGAKTNAKVQEYDNEKAIQFNRFADKVLAQARWRLRQLSAASIKIPRFSLYTVNGLEIKLRDGVIRGLDSMYRRSVTTGSVDDQLADLATVVGFSNLKVEYKYDAATKTVGTPPLSGLLVLNGDELTARLAVLAARDKNALELNFEYWQEAKAQSLTIEGPANRLIANFKHLLEHHIVSIMSTSLIHFIEHLGSLTKCRPYFIGKDDPMYKNIDSEEFDSFEDADQNETSTPWYPKTTKAPPTDRPYTADAEPDKSDEGGKKTTAEQGSINSQDEGPFKEITTNRPQVTPDGSSGEWPQDPKEPPPRPGPSDDEGKNRSELELPDNETKNPPQPGPSDDETKNPPQPGPPDDEGKNPPHPGPSDDEAKNPPQPEPSHDEAKNPPQPGPSDDEAKNPPQPGPSDDEAKNPLQPGPSDDEAKNPPQPGPSDDEAKNPPQPGPSDDDAKNPPQPGPSDDEAKNPPQPGPSDDEAKNLPQPGPSDDEAKNPLQPGPSDDEAKNPPQPGPSDDEAKNPPQLGASDDKAKNTPQPRPSDYDLPQNSKENREPSNPKRSPAPTYIVSKNESVELEFPAKPGSKQKETMLLNVKERFSLTRLKKKGGRKAGHR